MQRFTRFLREVLLLQTTGRLVVFVDEIDAGGGPPFSSDDFFSAGRGGMVIGSQNTGRV